MYVIFEGVDRTGKTTQLKLLKSKFNDILITKEPGGTELGKKFREILLQDRINSKRAEILLFLADRAEHYETVIYPNRNSKLILSDRGFVSGVAYALTDTQESFDEIIKLNKYALKDDLPDLIILFEIDEKTLKSRFNLKKQDRIEQRGVEYILNVQKEIKNVVKRLEIPYKIIDSSKSVDEVFENISKILNIG